MFRNEAELLSRFPDDYIAHEFLEETNDPMTFMAFADRASAHGLAYLGDADISSMIPENLDATTSVMLREMCGGQVLPIEQYMDIVTGRTFRQSLLVRSEIEPSISRMLDSGCIETLHLVASRDLRKVVQDDQSSVFLDGAGRNLRTTHPQVVSALDTLIARLPGSSAFADLVSADRDVAARAMITDALTKMLQVGILHLSLEPVGGATQISETPMVSPMTRLDAAGNGHVVNGRHEAVVLGLVARVVTPALDGTHDCMALQEIILKAVADGQIVFQREGVSITAPENLQREAASHLDIVLRELAANGLLTD